jgi:hypothetical protein
MAILIILQLQLAEKIGTASVMISILTKKRFVF